MYGIKPQADEPYFFEGPSRIKKHLRRAFAAASLLATITYVEMCRQTDRALSHALNTANANNCPVEMLDSKMLSPKMFGVIPFPAKLYVFPSEDNLREVDAYFSKLRIKDTGSTEPGERYYMMPLASQEVSSAERPLPPSPDQQKLCR